MSAAPAFMHMEAALAGLPSQCRENGSNGIHILPVGLLQPSAVSFLPDSLLCKLQSVQIATARFITGMQCHEHITLNREHTSEALRYDTHSQGISQFYLHTPHLSANGINHTCLCLPSQSWYSFTDPGGMEVWVSLGWLVGYIPK